MLVLWSQPPHPPFQPWQQLPGDAAPFFAGKTHSNVGIPFFDLSSGKLNLQRKYQQGQKRLFWSGSVSGLNCLCWVSWKRPSPTLDLHCSFLKMDKMMCWCREWWAEVITKHAASTNIMIVLKKENIISTGQCQHLHFFPVLIKPPGDHIFHFSLPYSRWEIIMCFYSQLLSMWALCLASISGKREGWVVRE